LSRKIKGRCENTLVLVSAIFEVMENVMNNDTVKNLSSVKGDNMSKGRMNEGAEHLQQSAENMANNAARTMSDAADTVSTKLKNVGVDTEVMANVVKEHTSDLQNMITNELQARPMRSLAIAAAIGAVIGMMTAR
jgi:ElaB/YqjD/DUF883 family membrane-anchored ribosome-binding protein